MCIGFSRVYCMEIVNSHIFSFFSGFWKFQKFLPYLISYQQSTLISGDISKIFNFHKKWEILCICFSSVYCMEIVKSHIMSFVGGFWKFPKFSPYLISYKQSTLLSGDISEFFNFHKKWGTMCIGFSKVCWMEIMNNLMLSFVGEFWKVCFFLINYKLTK